MDASMTTTGFAIDGYRVVRTLGIVRGITVRSRSIIGTLGGSLQTLVGGNITLFTELCEKTRGEAFDLMIHHAEAHGANVARGAIERAVPAQPRLLLGSIDLCTSVA